MTKVLFVYQVLMPFIKRDLELIQKNFETKIVEWPRLKEKPFSTIFNLFKNIKKTDIVICWFASYHALFSLFFAKLLRKKSIVITGGYDVIAVPEINYGVFTSSLKGKIVKWILENADLVLPFSQYAENQLLKHARPKKLKTIYLSCDTNKFKPNNIPKENLIVTVCVVRKENIERKGLPTFIKVAKELPQFQFAIIGPHFDDSASQLKKIAPTNLKLPGYLPERELIKWYQRAKVYCQLSYEEGEGFGGALGEAMACACIPVVSEKAVVLKEAVGETGFYVPYGDSKKTVKAILKALQSPADFGRKARERMLAFSPQKREKELKEVISDLLR
jgi:glycosyltransferase involved in cell wall biosynthesis